MQLVYTTTETAEMLGCSTDQVELLARTGKLPGMQYGRGWVFPIQAMHAAVNQQAMEQMMLRAGELQPQPVPSPAQKPAVLSLVPVEGRQFGPRRVEPPKLPNPTEPSKA